MSEGAPEYCPSCQLRQQDEPGEPQTRAARRMQGEQWSGRGGRSLSVQTNQQANTMKATQLIEILNVEPDAEVKVQDQLDWPWCDVQSTGMGADENGNKYVLLRTYNLEACIATRDSREPMSGPVSSEGGVNLADIHSTALRALDALGVALASHGHTWTPEERADYDKAVEILSLGAYTDPP